MKMTDNKFTVYGIYNKETKKSFGYSDAQGIEPILTDGMPKYVTMELSEAELQYADANRLVDTGYDSWDIVRNDTAREIAPVKKDKK